jgi:hypothetical protein
MRKRIVREGKTQQVTLTVNQTETCDASGKQISSVNQTFTADSVAEIERLLHLAGVGRQGGECPEAELPEDPTVRMLVLRAGHSHPEGCRCPVCPHPEGCQCVGCCQGIREGRELPPGFHDYEAAGPDEAIDLDFNTGDEDLDEDSTEHFDYGHRAYDETDSIDITAFSHDHGRAGNPVRYTPAKAGDNPMRSDMREDDEALEGEYSDAINDAVEQYKIDTHSLDAFADDIATRFDRDPDEVRQEILDQKAALADDGDDTDADIVEDDFETGDIVTDDTTEYDDFLEGRRPGRRLEESIQMLVENQSPNFLSAIHKVRDGDYDSLNAAEISNLASAFINLMQSPDARRVSQAHRDFRQYVGEAATLREYQKYTRRK